MTVESSRECYSLDDLVIDVGAVSVRRGEDRLSIPDLSFATLALLVRRAPDVVSHDELVEGVWNGMAVSDETITQRIALLRRALGDDSREPRYIRSVRGRGYQLVPAPQRIADEPAGVVGEPDREGPARTGRLLGVALFAVALAAAGIVLLRPSADREATSPGAVEAKVSANDLVERARDYFALHREEDNERAIELLQQSLQIEPDNVGALALLSQAYSQRAAKFNRPVERAREAEAIARRAIELAPDSAEAHHALGLSLDSQGRLSSALDGYRRAVELDPRHLRATGSGAYVLYVRGELAEALRSNLELLEQGVDLHYLEIQIAEILAALDFAPTAEAWFSKAVTLRPENLFAAVSFARHRIGRGDLAGAKELVRGAGAAGVERPELFEIQGHLAAMQGESESAAAFYRQALEVTPRSAASIRLLALPATPDVEQAEATIETLRQGLESGNEWPPSALQVAILSSALGDRPAALAAIDRAIDLGYRNSAWLLVDPALTRLREEAGFWQRIERIRELVTAERETVLTAEWLPDGFLDAAR